MVFLSVCNRYLILSFSCQPCLCPSRGSFVSRDNERVSRRWRDPGEETGRAAGTVALLLGSEGDIEIELESSPEGGLCGRTERERRPLNHGQTSCAAKANTNSEGDTKSMWRRVSFGRQGELNSAERAAGLAVSWLSPGCLWAQRDMCRLTPNKNYTTFDAAFKTTRE